MFYSEQLLSKDGPLAYAWLAANLEKKLTKQQLLNASITDSARAIEDSSRALEVSSSQRDTEPMALRLSGQLLYGIVRIYSRKAKYLYEDVSDILMKLKASFATSKSVILPLESTVIASVKNVTLADTVTEADLLYRQPLNFDEIFESQEKSGEPRISELAVDNEEETFPADESIEIPRRNEEHDDLDGENADFDLDLNFDIEGDDHEEVHQQQRGDTNEDTSIEVGRAADVANASAMDTLGDIELPDFQEPILDVDDGEDNANDRDEPTTPPDLISNSPVRGKKLPVYQKTDVVRTMRKRIIVDTITELSAQTLRTNQRKYLESEGTDSSVGAKRRISKRVSPEDVSSALAGNFITSFARGLHLDKKRRIEEPSEAVEPSGELPEVPEDHQNEDEFQTDFNDIDLAPQSPVLDITLDLGDEEPENAPSEDIQADVDLPGLSTENNQHKKIVEDDTSSEEKAAVHVAGRLREMLTTDGKAFDGVSVTFSDVIDADKVSEEPLAADLKSEASKMFFELLVLAGSDAVKLQQNRLFGEIAIEATDSLTMSFL
ncbi:hypothetical protein FOA43_004326 [Brettanomyces nanus]|uniref:Uncharacterized protein n=1 Tax=Eeniella nana TaxID=13502 RepID=A0A875SAZ1_EENNA|nr:uncharacterized protein FOA43_004326 [Brettanomyces nanus]QPG76932.1 hypothetical protein FOA43_004326 [Brettanomyces nanus]